MAKKVKARNIEVTEVFDNSVKVNISHSPKMAEAVDALVELEDETFHKVVKTAKSYRRINKATSKGFDCGEVHLTVVGTHEAFGIINLLISLGNSEFRKALRCAKKYRRANTALNNAISGYMKLQGEDKENQLQNMRLAYEG